MSDKGVKMYGVDILCQYMSRFNCKVTAVWQYNTKGTRGK